jgi:hypothetical protein
VIGLFALMAGGQLFGLPGMVIAVPVAASVRVVLIRLFPRLAAPISEARTGSAAAPTSRRDELDSQERTAESSSSGAHPRSGRSC